MFGLSLQPAQVTGEAVELTLLLTLLPSIQSLLWALLASLLSSSSSSFLLPFSRVIDGCLLRNLEASREVGVACSDALHTALCAWVRVRGAGGDRFTTTVVRWLIRCCEEQGNVCVCVCVCVCECACVCVYVCVCVCTVCGKKPLPLPFNETERNGPFTIRSSSVRGPCVFAVRFESVLIKYYYIRTALSALARGSL